MQLLEDREHLASLWVVLNCDLYQIAVQAKQVRARERTNWEPLLQEARDFFGWSWHHDDHFQNLVDAFVKVDITVEYQQAFWDILVLIVRVAQSEGAQKILHSLVQFEAFGDAEVDQITLSQ